MSCQASCATCDQLRAAALQIVAEAGIEAFSDEQLAAEVSLSVQDVAVHYPVAAACLHESFDREAADLVRNMVAPFKNGGDWQSSFESSRDQLVAWVSTHPASARLLFVEAVRGDRELRRRRDATRRQLVEFFEREYARSPDADGLPALQIELLVGAGFLLISDALDDGETDGIAELKHKLAELDGFFIPVHA